LHRQNDRYGVINAGVTVDDQLPRLGRCGDVAREDCDQEQTEPDSGRHGFTVLKVHRNLSVKEGRPPGAWPFRVVPGSS
jgi:hypothetical protein